MGKKQHQMAPNSPSTGENHAAGCPNDGVHTIPTGNAGIITNDCGLSRQTAKKPEARSCDRASVCNSCLFPPPYAATRSNTISGTPISSAGLGAVTPAGNARVIHDPLLAVSTLYGTTHHMQVNQNRL